MKLIFYQFSSDDKSLYLCLYINYATVINYETLHIMNVSQILSIPVIGLPYFVTQQFQHQRLI